MGFGDFIKSDPGGMIIGSAIGAVGSLIGGGINASNASAQMAMQREFAQNGIRWKVEDAKRAGIHPLAALGAQTFSYNPVMAGDNGIGEALGRMGQGIDRAVEAKQAAEERGLQRKLTEAQIDNVSAQADAARAQAEASRAAIAKTALPPAMPTVNNASASQSSSPFWEKPLISYAMRYDENGKPVDIVPSEAYKNRVEDVFGVEWLPFISAAIDNFKAKQLGMTVRGHHWDDKAGHYRKGPAPNPSKGRSSFARNIENSLSFY